MGDDLSDAVLLLESNQDGYLVTRKPATVYVQGRAIVAATPVANFWRPGTNYAGGAQVNSQGAVYTANGSGGTSAPSGTGPSGTGALGVVQDNTVSWQFGGQIQQTFTAFGSLQPLSGAELDRLPEGYRTKETRAFWTNSLLRTSGPDGTATAEGEADVVTAEGFSWQVSPMSAWENLGLYRKVLLVRIGR
jgi:hypothetical protein